MTLPAVGNDVQMVFRRVTLVMVVLLRWLSAAAARPQVCRRKLPAGYGLPDRVCGSTLAVPLSAFPGAGLRSPAPLASAVLAVVSRSGFFVLPVVLSVSLAKAVLAIGSVAAANATVGVELAFGFDDLADGASLHGVISGSPARAFYYGGAA